MLKQSLLVPLFSVALSASAQTVMNIDATRRGPLVSRYQYGLFFEEINHAGEGGLYAELVKNRSFEEGQDGWTAVGGAVMGLQTRDLLNNIQQTALTVNTSGASPSKLMGVSNGGFWGMAVTKDSTYTLTLWVKGSKAFAGHLKAQLRSQDGNKVLGETLIEGTITPTGWNKLTATITAADTDKRGQLALLTDVSGRLSIDMVSLFPYTWKNRKNGLRPDLAQLLANTRPSFLRFPGGCYVEGEGSYDNAFQWKKTIGPIEERSGHYNQNWRYYSSDGLGFDEYLQLAEDLGAAPLFVVNVGLGHGFKLSLEETKTLVQDALDAIEYANGDASTFWGAKRVANGHAEPYHLKFIEIGNENYQRNSNEQSEDYAERYKMFYDAIKAKYPDIITIGNVEAWGTDNPSWRNDYPVELVDEHYYRSYQWMRANYNKYDGYPRSIGVYNGEYAANADGTYGRYGNVNSALGEAIYMLGMERNSDVCRMASFAPIFTHENDPRWAYDMIHFNASDHFVTPSYHVQQLLGNSLGTQNLLWTETGNMTSTGHDGEKVGVGAWNTQVVYDDVQLTDGEGKAVGSDTFETGMEAWTVGQGQWTAGSGALEQTASAENCTAVMNVPVNGSDYIYKVRAKKTGGGEGFLIIFNYQDKDNYTWWNLGGWNNGKHGVEQCVGGAKTTITQTDGYIETDRWYDIEVEVHGADVTCRLDGETVSHFTLSAGRSLYQSVQLDENSGELLLKVVNPNSNAQQLTVNVSNMQLGNGTVTRLAGNGSDENSMDEPRRVEPSAPETVTIGEDGTLKETVPPFSLNVYRLGVSNVAAGKEERSEAYDREDEGMGAYLYAHMHSSSEHTSYALSRYGQNWTDLLGGAEVFDTKANTVTGGMRDAYVCRMKGGGFMLAGTDMTSRLGWTSNHIMELMCSPDLVHWTKNVKIDLESEENLEALGGISADDMKAAWAPQVIYDEASDRYVVYYSVGFPDRHRIYYQLIDRDLNVLTKPALYFDPGYDIIDADIVWNDVDKQYVMLYKAEKGAGFYRATATHLIPTADETTGTCQWTETPGFHVNENNQAIEAPTQWRPIGSKKWKLAYINYSGGSGSGYKMRDMDEHGLDVSQPSYISGSVAAQHGSIVKITTSEYEYLKTWEQVKQLKPVVEGYYKATQSAAIAEALAVADDALNTSTTFAENVQAMTAALTALQGCKAVYDEYIAALATSGKAADLTPLLVNASFSEGGTGWTASPAFTQANGQVAEFWNTSFDMHQTLDNLPKGDYEVGVQSFYREGGIREAVTSHDTGTENLYATFYANDAEMPVMSLYDSSATGYGISPYNYPDNVAQANEAFNTRGLYVHRLKLTLTEPGSITLGIRKWERVGSDWCCFDNFTLKYLGDPTGIAVVPAQKKTSESVYNLNGQRVEDGTLSHGIYIRNGKKVVQ